MANRAQLPHELAGSHVPLHPWYKERLRTKYLRDRRTRQHVSGALNAQRWRFLQPGLDDFRDGYPSTTGTWGFQQAQEEIQPSLRHAPRPTREPAHSETPKARKRFTKEQAYLSKRNALRQAQWEHVTRMERSLLQHPLALQPRVKESMPSQLFSQVVLALDLAIHVDNDELMTHKLSSSDLIQQSGTQTQDVSSVTNDHSKLDGSSLKNSYIWKVAGDKGLLGSQEGLRSATNSPHATSQDENVHKVTQQFSSWVVSLVGEDRSLSESALLDLFVSNYDRKPPLTFPDLRHPDLPKEPSHSLVEQQGTMTTGALREQDASKIWRKWSIDEPLVSGDLEHGQQDIKDEDLKDLHGTQAFRQFILSRGLREPKFLRALFPTEEQEGCRTRRSTNISASTRRSHVGV